VSFTSRKHLLNQLLCRSVGTSAPLLVAFLGSQREHSKWLKGYVVCVNFLGLVQTVLQIEQAFNVPKNRPPRPWVRKIQTHKCLPWRILSKDGFLPSFSNSDSGGIGPGIFYF
jgi:hypothetical protein